jgi:hypothetical protein
MVLQVLLVHLDLVLQVLQVHLDLVLQVLLEPRETKVIKGLLGRLAAVQQAPLDHRVYVEIQAQQVPKVHEE